MSSPQAAAQEMTRTSSNAGRAGECLPGINDSRSTCIFVSARGVHQPAVEILDGGPLAVGTLDDTIGKVLDVLDRGLARERLDAHGRDDPECVAHGPGLRDERASEGLHHAFRPGDDDVGPARQFLEAARLLQVPVAAVHDRQPGIAIVVEPAERGGPRVELPERLPELRLEPVGDAALRTREFTLRLRAQAFAPVRGGTLRLIRRLRERGPGPPPFRVRPDRAGAVLRDPLPEVGHRELVHAHHGPGFSLAIGGDAVCYRPPDLQAPLPVGVVLGEGAPRSDRRGQAHDNQESPNPAGDARDAGPDERERQCHADDPLGLLGLRSRTGDLLVEPAFRRLRALLEAASGEDIQRNVGIGQRRAAPAGARHLSGCAPAGPPERSTSPAMLSWWRGAGCARSRRGRRPRAAGC